MKHCKIILLVGLLASSASALAEKIGVSMAYFDQNFLTIIRQSIEKEASSPATSTYSLKTPRGDTGRRADQVQSFMRLRRGRDHRRPGGLRQHPAADEDGAAGQNAAGVCGTGRRGIKRYRPAWCLSVRTSGSLAHCRWRRWRSWQTTKATSPS